MSYAIVLFILAILAALACAGIFMLRKPEATGEESPTTQHRNMARALSVRIGLSIALFFLVLVAWQGGWIEPKGVPLAPK